MAKTIVYTAIAGGSDILQRPSVVDRNNFDYVCFTDAAWPPLCGVWSIRKMADHGLDAVRKAKEYKCLPHRYFAEYERSVWVDGNIDIIGDLGELLARYPDDNIVCFRHPNRDCAYREAETCIRYGKDSAQTIRQQMDFYRRSGFPERAGLIEANVLIRRHNAPEVVRLMEAWWEQIVNYSRRDQLSFPYVAWKTATTYAVMGSENSRSTSAYFRRRAHIPNTLRNRAALLKDKILLAVSK